MVFPLAGGDLSIGSGDVDTGEQACFVVGVSDDSAEAVAGTDGAVVGSLRAWVAILWPAERLSLELSEAGEHLVLLLDTIPWEFFGAGVPDLICEVTEVSVAGDHLLVGGVFPSPGLAHNHDVVALTEGIGEVSDGLKVDLGVFSGGLITARAIVVPHGNVRKALDFRGESSALGTEGSTCAVKPDVLSDNFSTLV